ncbi:hypothetical protein [Paenibacillus sp. GXUN7292]|uniref:hypothetical protein n=1 Tax=Paenibacillus sp. GXUN7292 TaxID=3422499 RepID=UPI003D7E65B8
MSYQLMMGLTDDQILSEIKAYQGIIDFDFSNLIPDYIRDQLHDNSNVFAEMEADTGEYMQIFVAVSLMYPFNLFRLTLNHEGLLKGLGIFHNARVTYLLEHGTVAELNRLIVSSATHVIEMAKTIPHRKLKWGENVQAIMMRVEAEFPELFAKVNASIQQKNLFDGLQGEIQRLGETMCRIATATMSPAEAEMQKKACCGKFEQMRHAILDAEVKRKEELFELVKETESNVLAFIDRKLAEEPVRLLYYWTGKKVMVKLGWSLTSYRYDRDHKTQVRQNRSKDSQEFPLVVSLGYIEDFLCHNEIRYQDVLIDERSIGACYSFDDVTSLDLSPAFVREWYNYDCPDLYRMSPNTNGGTNMLGMPLPHFSNKLVEAGWNSVYIDEDITDSEASALMKGFEHTRISAEIEIVLKSRSVDDVEALESWINAFDARIQSVVDKNAEAIKTQLSKKFASRVRTDENGKTTINDDFGLDCGFLHVTAALAEYKEKRGMLCALKSSASKWMPLTLPIFSQSTTFMAEQFRIAREFVYLETGLELVGHTVLD